MPDQATLNPMAALSGHLAGLADAAGGAIVGIRSHGRLVASGFAWQPGAIVTASDALEADDEIAVVVAGGKTLPARLAGRDPTTDVAVLRVGDGAPAPLTTPASGEPRLGELVLSLGRGRDGAMASLGMISAAGGPWQSMRGGNIDRLIRVDARLARHAEGSLVLDAQGHPVGMAVLGPRRRVLVIPASTVTRVGAKLLADGRIARGYLGLKVHLVRIDEALATQHALTERHALMVVGLDGNGPARAAGVLVGDIIVALDGQAVSGPRGLFTRLTPETVGKAAELKLVRAGQLTAATVTIAPSPAA